MKTSIKKRFFIIFGLILLIVNLGLLLFSNLFVNHYVVSSNQDFISKVYQNHQLYFQSAQLTQTSTDSIAGRNDIGIVVYEYNQITVCSSLYLCNDTTSTLPSYITKYFATIPVNQSKSFTFQFQLLEVNQLVHIYHLEDGKFIVINKALDSMEHMKDMMNLFIAFFSITTLIIESIVLYIITKRVTKPIITLSEQAQRIAKLDFSTQLTLNNSDEIGLLAENLNYIAERFEYSMNQLKDANHSLLADIEQKEALKQQQLEFFSQASHELKTPITIIQGYAEGLINKIVKDEQRKHEYYQIIFEEAKKMGQLVTNLMDVSHLNTNSIKQEPLDLIHLLHQVMRKFEVETHKRKIDIQITGPDTCMIEVDAFKLEQVIVNLMSNALKYVEQNGVIKLTVQENQKSVILSFFNDGEQIPEEHLDKIWELFYKINHHKNKSGTGLGLAIVKSIVELHRGTITVRNINQGVEFKITLPK
jgi:two-component system, OmpR family, sensor histidine kinase VanS